MSGTLVISLDFELMWGVRDHRGVPDYGDAVLGGRKAIPNILKLFEKHGIRATWATVGLLFARNRHEMIEYSPKRRPSYLNSTLSPYRSIVENVGDNETVDPYHFGRTLLDRIAETEGQEIGTHTFSHYYCLEKGQTIEEFDDDITSAKAIAQQAGVDLRSIVFPRNQSSPEAIRVCAAHGILSFRGNPRSYMERPRPSGEQSLLIRGLRLADSVLPLAVTRCHRSSERVAGSTDVPASRFFCPATSRIPICSDLFMSRVRGEMLHAAKQGLIYHLWWHPHNFGRQTEGNLQRLSHILEYFRHLADHYGMRSRRMGDFLDD